MYNELEIQNEGKISGVIQIKSINKEIEIEPNQFTLLPNEKKKVKSK